MLQDKTAVIHGVGAMGGAVARALAEAGAQVHLAGRSKAHLDDVAAALGGAASVAELDVLDAAAVAAHADAVAAEAGGIDIALNAAAFPFAHDRPFTELEVDEVLHPVDVYLRANLATAKAVAPHLSARGAGTILTLSSAAALGRAPGQLGFGTACTAVEELSRRLAVELAPARVVCLRANLVADAAHDSATTELFEKRAAAAGVTIDALLDVVAGNVTLLGRLPTLADVGAAAVFACSDHAAALTGTVLDLTSGNALRTATGALVGVLG